jgi:hypothetical protein
VTTLDSIKTFFRDPTESRNKILTSIAGFTSPPPTHGSSFFIHLSELCPVACHHCMYSSDLNRKTEQESLSDKHLQKAIDYINESQSAKLNITGGGEPFLQFDGIVRLLESVEVPRIEIVSAGYWATTLERTTKLLTQLDEARARNPHHPDVLLRLSLDRYHIEAPRPVTIEHYANVGRVWSSSSMGFKLGFRSIMPDRDKVDRQLAAVLDAEIVEVDDWNRRLVFANGKSAPITFNVLRFSGKASTLPDELRKETKGVREYYKPFETGTNRLTLATAINDAIRGSYTPTTGLSITLNSDGTLWIFCGTSPDRKLKLGQNNFHDSVRHFFADPITHLLVDDGVWALADLVRQLDAKTHANAMLKNDVAFLVEDLLAPEDVRLAVTILLLRLMHEKQQVALSEDSPVRALLDAHPSTLLELCQQTLRAQRQQ